MPDFIVSTAFKAQDHITKAFGSMVKGADKFGDHADRAFKKASKSGSRMGDVFKGIMAASVVQEGIQLIKRGIGGIVGEAAKLENAVIDFKTLTGSIDTAKKMVQDLRALGAATPFETGDLADATKVLLGFGAVTQKDLVPTLKMLGDTAGGSAEKLGGIALAYGQIVSGGRAYQQDINQLINRGVPIIKALSQLWGVNIAKVREYIKEGKANGDTIKKAFQLMTKEGGAFFNGMENSSKTLTGRWSTFVDFVKIAAGSIGTALLPQMKRGVDLGIIWAEKISAWAEANSVMIGQRFDKFIAGVSDGFRAALPYIIGAGKATAMLYGVLKPFIPILPVIIGGMIAYSAAIRIGAFIAFVKVLHTTIAAQGLLNAVMTANPIGAVIVGVTALVAGGVLLYKHWDKVKELFGRVWKAFDNPVVQAAALLFAPFIGIPALIIKNWEPIKDFFAGIFDKISGFIDKLGIVQKIGGFFGFGGDEAPAGPGVGPLAEVTPPNRAEVEARQAVSFNGRIDIAGAPAGSMATSKTTGAPPIRMQMLGANP